jgi:sulfur-oxidizing protein SoxY
MAQVRTTNRESGERVGLSRRSVLRALGAAGLAAATGAPVALSPRPASAQPLGRQESVEAALRRLFGSRPLTDGSRLIRLGIPAIAENGAAVPVSVEVDAPMTPQSHVRHIWLIADRNRIPVVTRAALTPDSGQAYLAVNIRLGETGDVRVVVEQSDGTLLAIKREVKVTVSGCGV